MLFQKMGMKDGQLVVLESKTVDQSTLTSDCWLIQIQGLAACENCQCINKKTGKPKTRGENACGGVALLKEAQKNVQE